MKRTGFFVKALVTLLLGYFRRLRSPSSAGIICGYGRYPGHTEAGKPAERRGFQPMKTVALYRSKGYVVEHLVYKAQVPVG